MCVGGDPSYTRDKLARKLQERENFGGRVGDAVGEIQFFFPPFFCAGDLRSRCGPKLFRYRLLATFNLPSTFFSGSAHQTV